MHRLTYNLTNSIHTSVDEHEKIFSFLHTFVDLAHAKHPVKRSLLSPVEWSLIVFVRKVPF